MDIKNKVLYWAQEVVDYCNPVAKTLNLDFYCFQSFFPTASGVELMVIGINPGGSGGYRGDRLPESLAQGNNIYDVRPGRVHPDNRVMTQKLARVFTTPPLQEALAEALVMNIYYFNTQNVDKLDRSLSAEVKGFCEQKTRELIDLVRPRHILFLCTSDRELATLGVRQIKSLGNYMKSGDLNGCSVLMLPNPGYYRAYSYANGAVMGQKIENYLNQ